MSRGRVLVVDDEANVRKIVRLTLTKAGYEVIEAEDGELGMQAIRWGDNPLMVDAIVCDVRMPKIDGQEAIGYFRSQFPSVPVIVLTGHPTLEGAKWFFVQGVMEYLTKPVTAETLTASVHKAVEAHELFKDQFVV